MLWDKESLNLPCLIPSFVQFSFINTRTGFFRFWSILIYLPLLKFSSVVEKLTNWGFTHCLSVLANRSRNMKQNKELLIYAVRNVRQTFPTLHTGGTAYHSLDTNHPSLTWFSLWSCGTSEFVLIRKINFLESHCVPAGKLNYSTKAIFWLI